MKKHRRVGNVTSINFFTSEFKLKSTQFPKESRQRKTNTTFSNFKHQLFQEEPKVVSRYKSKDSKPVIEQLNFITSKDDGFKLPQSVTRRSHSKTKEQSRLKMEIKNNQPYDTHYQEVAVGKEDVGRKVPLYQFAAAAKRIKQSSVNNPLKQKLERSALQKFNEAILKQNQENQNVVSEKNAESLYLLLKTARMNQFKHKNSKLRSLPPENEEEQHNSSDEVEQRNTKQRKQSESGREIDSNNHCNSNKNMKQVIKSKQNLFRSYDEKGNHTVDQPPRLEIPKPRPPIPVSQQPNTEVIHFKKVICDQTENQKFTSSQQESDFGQELQEVSKIQAKTISKPVEKPKEKPIQKLEAKKTVPQMQSKASGSQAIVQKPLLQKEAEKAKQNSRKSMQSDEQIAKKKRVNTQTKKPELKQKKYEQSDLDNIPSVEAYLKNVPPKQPASHKQVSKPSDFLEVNNKKIEMVLTPKHLEHPTVKTVPKINPPPKLASNLSKRASYPQEEDDELEQIQLGHQKNKKDPQPPKSKKEIAQQLPQQAQQPFKPQQANKQKTSTAPTSAKEVPAAQPPTTNELNEQQQQSEQIADELAYYIERIEDIGQYRINSKDVYSDKSIDKELLQIHKICAYYMAHQFLYLAQWTCNYFKGGTFHNGYYSLTQGELQELKQNGLLDEQMENISANVEDIKRLLKKCYEECKPFLKKEEQILIIDGKTNYHIRCCAFIIKEFKKIYELYQQAPSNTVMIRRCVYLIEIYCALKLLNGEELKEYQEFQDIENPLAHIEDYKKLLLSL